MNSSSAPRGWSRLLAGLVLAGALAAPRGALALPRVFHSEAGDGSSSGEAAVAASGDPTPLDLWLDAEVPLIGFTLSFRAEPGLSLLGFVPEPVGDPDSDIQFNLIEGDAGSLRLLGGDGFALLGPRIRIGALVVSGSRAGGQLWLDRLPGSDEPSVVTQDFSLIDLEVPARLALVPEPGGAALLALAFAFVFRRIR